ncbi:hypothetical protein B0T25DRAFT_535098 [Lasiosphaeria hispida]|uniref:Secreted protein n=1 Tax=Lasiosphaeria hispida TaxID=260671 RepID=A0AAJ0HS87_9PEZI|nr:hypothetical protein B0T25DRAFT_535098 [Lasiosphaeria hispida]
MHLLTPCSWACCLLWHSQGRKSCIEAYRKPFSTSTTKPSRHQSVAASQYQVSDTRYQAKCAMGGAMCHVALLGS